MSRGCHPTTIILALSLWAVATGCGTSRPVVVQASPPPAVTAGLPKVDTRRIEHALVTSEADVLGTEAERRFAAAREAFYNRSTDEAVSILRDLIRQGSPKTDTNHAALLIAEFYQQDGRWKEAAEQWSAINTGGRFRHRLDMAQRMAELPPRTIAFQSNSVPIGFTLARGQLVMASAKFNGVAARVLVDTGFNMSLVSDTFARRAGITVQPWKIGFRDANERTSPVPVALVRELEFGPLRAANVPVISSPLGYLDNIVGQVDAVIGWDLLQQADVTWDFPALRLSISQPSGPLVPEPKLSGRKEPLLKVVSVDGRPLDLFLDTGFASKPPSVGLAANAGLLHTKIDERRASRTWRPTLNVGMRSFRVRWPKRIEPFPFWFDGHTFTMPWATIRRSIDVREGVQTGDGVIGNGPFLSGRLRLCAVRRLAEFTPGSSTPSGDVR